MTQYRVIGAITGEVIHGPWGLVLHTDQIVDTAVDDRIGQAVKAYPSMFERLAGQPGRPPKDAA